MSDQMHGRTDIQPHTHAAARCRVTGVVAVLLCLLTACAPERTPPHPGLSLTLEEQAWLSANPEIDVLLLDGSPPYSFQAEDGSPMGISIDLLEAVERRLGIRFRPTMVDERHLFERARTGETPISGPWAAQTIEPGLPYRTTRPFVQGFLVLLSRTGAPTVSDVDLLTGKTLLATPGVAVPKPLASSNQVLIQDSEAESLKMLLEGEGDYALSYEAVARYIIREQGITGLDVAGVVSEPHDGVFLVHEDEPVLLSIFDKAITDIETSEMPLILARWHTSADRENGLRLTSEEQAWLNEHPVVECWLEPEAAPFSYLTGDGQIAGIAGDLFAVLEQRIGVEFDYQMIRRTERLRRLEGGDADAACTILPRNTVDANLPILWTGPFTRLYVSLFGRTDGESITDPGLLRDKVIASRSFAADRFGLAEHNRIEVKENAAEAIGAVLSGEADFFLEVTEVGKFNLRATQTHGIQELYTFAEVDEGAIAVHRSEPLFHSILDKALADIEDQELLAILGKWYVTDQAPTTLRLTEVEKTWIAEHPVIRIAVDPDYAPLEFVDDAGRYRGLVADYLAEFEEMTGLEFRHVATENWSESVAAIRNGKVDMLPANVATEDFTPDFLFSDSYYEFADVIVANHNTSGSFELEDLAGQRVISVADWPETFYLRQNYPEIEVVEVSNTTEGLLKLSLGECDFMFAYRPTVTYYIQQEGISGLRMAGQLQMLWGDGSMIRNDWPELVAILNKALAAMPAETIDAIHDKWLGVVTEQEQTQLGLTAAEKAWLDEHHVLRFGGDPGWAPIEYQDDDGFIHGVAVEYLQALEEILGVRFEPVGARTWSETLDRARNREIDIVTSVAATEDRSRYLDFTRPFLSLPVTIFARDDVPFIGGLGELAGKKVLVIDEYFFNADLARDYPEIEQIPTANTVDALERLQRGEADVFLGGLVTTSYYIGEMKVPGIKVAGDTPYSFELGLGSRNDWPMLGGILQKGLDAIPEARHREIHRTWLSLKYEHGFDYTLLWRVLAVVMVVLASAFIWIYYLRRMVRARTVELQEAHDALERRVEERTGELQRALVNLASSEERFDLAMRGSNDGLFDWNYTTGQVYYSDRWFDMLGLEPGAMAGVAETFFELCHPDDQAAVSAAVDSCIENGADGYSVEFRMQHEEGRWVPILSRASAVRDPGSDDVIRFVGTHIDLTERKLAERTFRYSLDLWQSSRETTEDELLSAVLEEGVLLTSSRIGFFHSVDTGRGVVELKTWTGELMEECRVEQLSSEYPISEAGIWVECIETKKPVIHNDYRTAPNRKGLPDGHVPLVRDMEVPVIDNGTVVAIIGVGNKEEDYTQSDLDRLEFLATNAWATVQRSRAEAQLREARDEAQAANKAKSTFLANMSHEIRTPMNAILGHAQIMRRDTGLSDDQRTSVNSINRSGEHLLALINDILDMSKIEAGKIQIVPNSFLLHALLEEMADMFHLRVEAKDLQLDLDIEADLPDLVLADENRVRQVLINLLGNAVKFTDIGGIGLIARLRNGLIEITVSDTGCGIEEDRLETVFEAFEQVETGTRTAEGTGLGLAISRQVARLMGGDITAESTLGTGSRFRFSFAYEEGQAERLEVKSQTSRVTHLRPDQSEVRVLVVDDREQNRTVARMLLEPIGFMVAEAVDGKEAVELAQQWNPQVILMDVVMPVMGGAEATERIKSTPWGEKMVIIAVSASALDDEREYVLAHGVDAFLSKPFKDHELLEEIRRHVGVEYEYDDAVEDESSDVAVEILPDAIDALPPALKERVGHAAVVGDLGLLQALAAEVAEADPHLGDAFQRLVDGFELDRIRELFG